MKSSFLGLSVIDLRVHYKFKPGFEAQSGGYGSYYKLDEYVGVKVLQSRTSFSSMREAAEIEAKNGKAAESSGFTPKYYGAVEVIMPSGQREWGIMIEHIEGVKLYDYLNQRNERYLSTFGRSNDIGNKLKAILAKKTGIYHRDTHANNVILKKVGKKFKIYLIDFSAECSYPEKSGTNIPNRNIWFEHLDFDRTWREENEAKAILAKKDIMNIAADMAIKVHEHAHAMFCKLNNG